MTKMFERDERGKLRYVSGGWRGLFNKPDYRDIVLLLVVGFFLFGFYEATNDCRAIVDRINSEPCYYCVNTDVPVAPAYYYQELNPDGTIGNETYVLEDNVLVIE